MIARNYPSAGPQLAGAFIFALSAYFWDYTFHDAPREQSTYFFGTVFAAGLFLTQLGQLIYSGTNEVVFERSLHITRLEIEPIYNAPFNLPVGFSAFITLEGKFPADTIVYDPVIRTKASGAIRTGFDLSNDKVFVQVSEGKIDLKYNYVVYQFRKYVNRTFNDRDRRRLRDQIRSLKSGPTSFSTYWGMMSPVTGKRVQIGDVLTDALKTNSVAQDIQSELPAILEQIAESQ